MNPLTPKADPLYVGLMSGTSVDAIDCALVRCGSHRCGSHRCGDHGVELLATHEHDIPPGTRERIAAISHSGDNEIERLGPLDCELGELFAQATLALLAESGTPADQVRAIGSHGQTIRHRPPSGTDTDTTGFTLQIGDPNTIAERTGITTVADFRRRDMAAGGEGAPLAPAFHAAALSREGSNRAIVNIGGIANLSLLRGKQLLTGFDTGPGNTLMDHWIQRHQGTPYDRSGSWGASGKVLPGLLQSLQAHPYFRKSGPRSTGKEAFNLAWLDNCLASHTNCDPVDVQATLAELTVGSISAAIDDSGLAVHEIYICGGGAHNDQLMGQLQQRLSPVQVATTAAIGLDPDWVEAIAFAWLASRTLDKLAGNAPAVTGAAGPRVLGAIYAGAQQEKPQPAQ